MNMRYLFRLLFASMLLVMLVACGGGGQTDTAADGEGSSAEATEGTVLEDAEGGEAAAEGGEMAEGNGEAAAESGEMAEGGEMAADSGEAASGDIPVFPEATEPDADSQMAQMLETMKDQMAQQEEDIDMQVEAYTLPEGTAFEDVRSFYEEEMSQRGWQAEEGADDMFASMPGGGAAAWSKGTNEAFAIVMMEDPSTGGSFLIITRGTR
jgi:hypothetical protein